MVSFGGRGWVRVGDVFKCCMWFLRPRSLTALSATTPVISHLFFGDTLLLFSGRKLQVREIFTQVVKGVHLLQVVSS